MFLSCSISRHGFSRIYSGTLHVPPTMLFQVWVVRETALSLGILWWLNMIDASTLLLILIYDFWGAVFGILWPKNCWAFAGNPQSTWRWLFSFVPFSKALEYEFKWWGPYIWSPVSSCLLCHQYSCIPYLSIMISFNPIFRYELLHNELEQTHSMGSIKIEDLPKQKTVNMPKTIWK